MNSTEAANVNRPMNRRAKTSIVIFFIFMLLHQMDKLLISPLAPYIKEEFNMNDQQWGAINMGALLVGALCYPLWGWLSDKYNRGRLLALASLVWGTTTMLNAKAWSFGSFLVSRSSTGIDDSSYPGMYSLISDYYPAKIRGKVYGILQLSQPVGFLLGMALSGFLIAILGGWRNIFIVTGSIGIALAVVIFFVIKEVPRGSSEEELQGVETSKYKFNWKTVGTIFKRPSLIFIYLQGFFGVFPWNVIVYFIFLYLASERFYDPISQYIVMAPAVLCLSAGYPLGGWFGDKLFKRIRSGRLIASVIGVVIGMVGLFITLNLPTHVSAVPIKPEMLNFQDVVFIFSLCITALFIPFASPNIISTVYDVTVPEIRSTANAVENFLESIGAAFAPWIMGTIALHMSYSKSMLLICTIAWALCGLFLFGAIYFVPKDIKKLHNDLQARAAESAAR